jgi:hypothetical protein
MGRLLVFAWLALVAPLASSAHADTIAMLPLDGDKRLELYGQPVAAEIARALKAAGHDVVVVGARMDVPDRAQLIVDGTIKSAKNKQVELSIRLRDPRDGTVLATLPAPATKLDDLDKAAADLSARVVPSVKSHLETLAKAATPAVVDSVNKSEPQPPVKPAKRVPTLTATTIPGSTPQRVLLSTPLDRETALWAATQRYDGKLALEVLSYNVRPGKVPTAWARVSVRIYDGNGIKFNRVVRTDTIVGDRDASPDQLAARAAREVLAIVQPHLRRTLRR